MSTNKGMNTENKLVADLTQNLGDLYDDRLEEFQSITFLKTATVANESFEDFMKRIVRDNPELTMTETEKAFGDKKAVKALIKAFGKSEDDEGEVDNMMKVLQQAILDRDKDPEVVKAEFFKEFEKVFEQTGESLSDNFEDVLRKNYPDFDNLIIKYQELKAEGDQTAVQKFVLKSLEDIRTALIKTWDDAVVPMVNICDPEKVEAETREARTVELTRLIYASHGRVCPV